MQELRIVLIVVGIILIIALLAHGFWSSRKQRPEKLVSPKQSLGAQESSATRDEQGFDDLGVGQARVIGDPIEDAITQQEVAPAAKPAAKPAEVKVSSDFAAEPSAPVQRKEPEFSFSAVDEAPSISDSQGLEGLEPKANPEAVSVEPEPSTLSSEPEFAFDMDEVKEELVEPVVEEPQEPVKDPNAPDDVFILNVMAQSGRYLRGAALLASLDKIGLRHGDMDIFHRHLDNSGTGPVIFSLANMVNPGTFDIDAMDQLETRGVSIFMTVPCKGEPTKNFALMYNAAMTLAKDLDAIMLDDQRNPLTKQTVNHYEQRVREYERKQLLVN
ncbi:cell division protein ZipA [Agarivorans sp. B2Z047]|uniref:cell division protein ZipA n=1 Tax=Agarivorans sp. B2Z047 TaxID=2652721 RepID=UPI00128C181A|nr:cell division protein ZipA [Agarivorans sp. B2Z047]MPW27684.1 cell division protein ZipA [Agarivorans sp. B2Z047]UQN44477.1 cell division protein ZipA [Agarivorans sp. B2Z047]